MSSGVVLMHHVLVRQHIAVMSWMQPPLHDCIAVGILPSVSFHILFCDVHCVSDGVRYPTASCSPLFDAVWQGRNDSWELAKMLV